MYGRIDKKTSIEHDGSLRHWTEQLAGFKENGWIKGVKEDRQL